MSEPTTEVSAREDSMDRSRTEIDKLYLENTAMRKSITIATLLVAALAMVDGRSARGVEVLGNGGLEISVSPVGWTQTETVTGMPGTPISLAEHISTSNSPNDAGANPLGIFIKPRSGNTGPFDMQNKMINYMLSQTVFGSAGAAYTLTGDARLTAGYSGAVEFLDPLSPSDPDATGTVPSPTETIFEVAFLNASNQVIGTPTVLDLRTATTTPDLWESHTLVTPVSPVGTTNVRVTAAATNIVDNFGGQQLDFDNFKLVRGTQTIDRLTNGDLNLPGSPAFWTLTESPFGTDNSSFIDFAHHPTDDFPTGQGLWVRAFEGGDALLEQTVPAVAGGDYTFSAWTVWEAGYSGDSDAFPGTTTDSFLELAFLDASSAVIGTPNILDLDAAGMNNDDEGNIELEDWRQFSINATAPAGAASVRVGVRTTGLFNSGINPQSAFFDEFSLDGPGAVADADLDNDGDVDGIDFLLIQRGFGTTTSAADIENFRNSFGSATIAAGAVPEPASAVGAAIFALMGVGFGRRRRA
jgi:hypothetical protein